MDGPPPPPPPHGEKPNTTEGEYRRSSDLPPGNYDIFVVPPHSSGSGFLYLPSLQTHRNSFFAGVVSTLLVVVAWSLVSPAIKTWYIATASNGNSGANSIGMVVMALGVGVAGWALGSSQSKDGFGGGENGGSRFGSGFFGTGSTGPNANRQSNANGGAGHQRQHHGGSFGGGQQRGNQHQHENEQEPEEKPDPPKPDKNDEKEKAEREREREREEAKRKEDLRRKMEEFKRKREAEAKEKERKREREAMEKELKERREQLEREMAAARAAAEKEARAKMAKEAAEARAAADKAAAEAKAEADRLTAEAKAARDKVEAEAKDKAAKEAAEKEAAAKEKAQKEAMAKFAALKEAAAKRYAEKKAQEAKEKEKEKASRPAPSAASAPRTPSPQKKPPYPTARTTVEEDDAYSFRPYDRPRRPYGNASGESAYSESSYAPSQSTSRTTPPPSHRSAYSTKDPDKIVIQGVYAFNNAYMKTPIAQLVSGQGMVTDGLVLRMTTEGLFVDDDLRGVGQREWDVKAWTLKLTEIWCPQIGAPAKDKPASNNPFSFRRGGAHVPTSEESDAFTSNLLKVCKNTCRLASPSAYFARSSNASGNGGVNPPQAEFRGLHVLRASLRDQEGKKYVFVLQDTEAWKVAIGLQRLRGGALVRGLGVAALPVPDCKSILGGLGYI